MKKTVVLLLCLTLVFSSLVGCNNIQKGDSENNNSSNQSSNSDETTNTASPSVDVDFDQDDNDMFTERDADSSYDKNNAVLIELKNDTAVSSSNNVNINGSIITITENKTHIISGTLDDGMIIVDCEESAKLQLVFDNVSITSKTSAPLYIKEADKVFVTLVGENTLSSGDVFEAVDENNIDSAIFSKQDLTFNGTGTLTVSSPAGHGIVCKDDLVFISGTYNITSANHAVDANDSVRIKNAEINANAGKDGIHSENNDNEEKGFVYISNGSFNITCEGDGISAGAYMQIEGGTFEITAGGGYTNGTKESSSNWGNFGGGRGDMFGGGMKPGSRDASVPYAQTSVTTDDSSTSMKGLKSNSDMQISGGSFNINSADDSIHSNSSLTILGGSFDIASGDDAMHAEESISISDGQIKITDSYEGIEALHISISGGNINLKASDDGLNAAGGTDQSGMGGRDNMFGGNMMSPMGFGGGNSNGSIDISGGTIFINASGDGIDSNGSLEITGGHTTVVGPTQGDTATLDYDTSGTITGGTFIGTGAQNMAQSFSSAKQGVIAVSVGNQSAGTKIIIKDKDGNEIVSHTPELSFQIIIISTPELKSGEKYTVIIGSDSNEFEAK